MPEHAFIELGMDAVNADAVLKNASSRHALKSVGFQFVREDEIFKYYRRVRDSYEQYRKAIPNPKES